MKKIKFLIFGLVIFSIFNINCLASTNTFTRTNDNLLVPKDVVVDQNNISSIMKTPAVSSDEKLYDYAEILNDQEEKKLVKKINNFIDSSSIDVAIVTTKDLLGFDIATYAFNFYDFNNFLDDGVIFVIYINGSEPEIYMGNSGKPDSGKVFSIYTNSRINQTLEYVYKDINSANYYKGLDNYIKILDGFYNIEQAGEYSLDEDGNVVKVIPWVSIIVLSGTLAFIFSIFLFYKMNSYKNEKISLDNKINTDTLMIRTDKDELVESRVVNNK